MMHLGPNQAGGGADGARTLRLKGLLRWRFLQFSSLYQLPPCPSQTPKRGDLARISNSHRGLTGASGTLPSVHTCPPRGERPWTAPRPTTPAAWGRPPQATPVQRPLPRALSQRGALQDPGGGLPAPAPGEQSRRAAPEGSVDPHASRSWPPIHGPDTPHALAPGAPALLVWGSARNSGPTTPERAWRLPGPKPQRTRGRGRDVCAPRLKRGRSRRCPGLAPPAAGPAQVGATGGSRAAPGSGR